MVDHFVSHKLLALLQLARRRQSTRWPGYKFIGDYHRGVYECDFVSPYTRTAGNVDSEVMVLLQDWASDEVLSGPVVDERVRLGHDPTRATNRRLRDLLRRHFGLEQVYGTNLFPFIKMGSMNSAIPQRDLVRAAVEFGLPQVEIVGPRTVVCLGLATFNALAVAAGRRGARRLDEAIGAPFLVGGAQVWCQAHTGQQGTNMRNRGGVDRVTGDWARMAEEHRRRA